MEFLGEIDDAGKSEFLSNAYALLFPIDWAEPFGLVMIEAMACGTPTVAFRRGSVPEVLDGISGYVVDDVEQAVEALEAIRDFDRARCRRVFEERFSVRRMAQDYVKIYQRVIDGSEQTAVQATVLRPISTDPVWQAIAERDLRATYADYWLAYRLVFEDRRDVLVIPLANDYYGIGGKHQQGADAAFFYRDSGCLAGWLEVVRGMNMTATTEPIGDYVLVRTPQPVPVPVIAAAMAARC